MRTPTGTECGQWMAFVIMFFVFAFTFVAGFKALIWLLQR